MALSARKPIRGGHTHKSRLRRFACDTCLRTSSCTFNSRPQGSRSAAQTLTPAKKKRHAEACLFFLAGDEGFEPPQTESESGVLPLHKSPKLPQRRNASIIIAGLAHLSSVIFQKSAKAANFSAPAFPFPGSFFRTLRQNRRLRAAFQLLTRKSVLFLLAGSMRGIARAAPY